MKTPVNTVFKSKMKTAKSRFEDRSQKNEETLKSPQNKAFRRNEDNHKRFDALYDVGRAHRSHRWGHRFESCCDHHNLSENVKFSDIFYITNRSCSSRKRYWTIKRGIPPQISAIWGNLGRLIPLNLWIRLLTPPQIVIARRISYPRQLSAYSAVTFSLPLHRKYPAPS